LQTKMESKSNKFILGYWNVRGVGGILHNLLNYCEIPYEDHIYTSNEQWFDKEKYALGLDFPNLPYIIDGDKKIAETLALMHYIVIKGNRKELLGADDFAHCRVLEAYCAIRELRTSIISVCFTKGDFRKEIKELFTGGVSQFAGASPTVQLPQLESILSRRDWIVDTLTIADFWLLELIEVILEIDGKLLDPYPNLLKFRERFIEIPKVKEFRQSDHFVKQIFWTGANSTWNNVQKKENEGEDGKN